MQTDTEQFLNKLIKFKGSAKRRVSDEEFAKIRDEVSQKVLKKFS